MKINATNIRLGKRSNEIPTNNNVAFQEVGFIDNEKTSS